MQKKLMIVVIALLATVFALVAQLALAPPSSDAMKQYQIHYQAVTNKPEVTMAEKQELDRLFREVNSSENIQAAMIDAVIRHTAFYLVLIPLVVWGGLKSRLGKEETLVAAGIVFLIFILAGSPVTGGVTAALFVLLSLGRRPRPISASMGEVPPP